MSAMNKSNGTWRRRTGQVPVDGREGVELVLEQVLVLGVEVTVSPFVSTPSAPSEPDSTHARMSLPPSTPTRVLLPTISDGKTRSSRIFSWTAVNVRDRGRFWPSFCFRDSFRSIRRWATKTMYRSESFFSSSRVSLGEGQREGGE